MADIKLVRVPGHKPIRILQWLVKKGEWIKHGTPLAVYRPVEDPTKQVKEKEVQLKSKHVGTVKMFLMHEGQVAIPDGNLMEIEGCSHPVVMKDMCAECGQDLKGRKKHKSASVSMIPNIPELRISAEQAEEIAQQDKDRLHKMRKLVLLVDLDQTLIHTTQDPGLAALCQSTEDFYNFQLSKSDPTLFTKLRPHCREFLKTVSQCYELQIVTFGSRQYAHKIADFIDKEKKYFAHRILSRDECIHPFKKSGNLRHLFPCGDSMVCIIDDRDDVWNAVPNLIVVKKYSYFQGAGDINNPYKQTTNNGTQKAKPDVDAHSPKKRKSEVDNSTENKASKAKRPRNSNEEDATEELTLEVFEQIEMSQIENIEKQKLDSNENNIPSGEEKDVNVDDDLGLSSDSESSSSTGSSSSNSNSNSSSDGESQSQPKDDSVQDEKNGKSAENGRIIDPLNETKVLKTSVEDSKEIDCAPSQNETNKEVIDSTAETTKPSNNVNTEENSSGETCPESSQQSVMDNTSSQEPMEREVSGLSCGIQEYVSSSQDATAVSDDQDDSRQRFSDADDYLHYLQDILLQIHSTYYEAYDKYLKKEFKDLPDVRGVVPFLRSRVLYGCFIVMTGVIPQNNPIPLQHHKAFVVARQMGAQMEEQISEKTTHLIAAKKGTAKYQDVKRRGQKIFTVGIDWLWCCSERWERVPEKLFPVPDKNTLEKMGKEKPTRPPTALDAAIQTQRQTDLRSMETYDPITGKLMKKVKDERFNFMVAEADRRRKQRRKDRRTYATPLYSSLKVPDAVIPVVPGASAARHSPLTKSNTTPATYATQARSRKRSMAEMVPVGYSLSTDDIADMDKEVDDLLESSDDDSDEQQETGNAESSSTGKTGAGLSEEGERDIKNRDDVELGTLIEIPEDSQENSQAPYPKDEKSSEGESEEDKESSDEFDEMDKWLKKEMPDFYASDDDSMDVPRDDAGRL